MKSSSDAAFSSVWCGEWMGRNVGISMSDNSCLRGGDRESLRRDDIIIAEKIVYLRGDMYFCLCLFALFPLLFWAVLSVVLCGFVCPSGLLFLSLEVYLFCDALGFVWGHFSVGSSG